MSKNLTVGELRKALENVPDDLEIRLSSDSGVDQSCEMGDTVVIEDAYRVKYELPNGERFSDTGKTGTDYFTIYANYINEYEE